MKIRGQLVDILLETFPGVYDKYVRYEEKKNYLCTDAQITVPNACLFNFVLQKFQKGHESD